MSMNQTSAASIPDQRSDFLTRLKAETREAHERTELAVALPLRLESLETYRDFLFRYVGLHGYLEMALLACTACPEFARERLNKRDLLRQDLLGLGVIAASIPRCDNLPTLATTADCYGCLYVLEGSTLGGQIICREVARRFPHKAPEISRFFQPYGERTREMWTDFCSSLSDFGATYPEAQGSVIDTAQQTFLCFERWLQK